MLLEFKQKMMTSLLSIAVAYLPGKSRGKIAFKETESNFLVSWQKQKILQQIKMLCCELDSFINLFR